MKACYRRTQLRRASVPSINLEATYAPVGALKREKREMRAQNLVILCTLLLALSLLALAGETTKRIWEGDARASQKVAVTAEGMPIRDLLAALSDKTGVSVSAADELADEKVMLFSPARPLRDLLEDL